MRTAAKFTSTVVLAVMMAIGMATSDVALRAKSFGVCDVSGAYTDRLCLGEEMHNSEYIESANEQYRFYFQADGSAYIFDVSDPDPGNHFVEHCISGISFANAHELRFGLSDSPYFDIDIAAYNTSDVRQWGIGVDSGPDGNTALILDDDGYLRVYDQDGTRHFWTPTHDAGLLSC